MDCGCKYKINIARLAIILKKTVHYQVLPLANQRNTLRIIVAGSGRVWLCLVFSPPKGPPNAKRDHAARLAERHWFIVITDLNNDRVAGKQLYRPVSDQI
jgi:hypothetical protein